MTQRVFFSIGGCSVRNSISMYTSFLFPLLESSKTLRSEVSSLGLWLVQLRIMECIYRCTHPQMKQHADTHVGRYPTKVSELSQRQSRNS